MASTPSTYLYAILIINGRDLPKTDTFGKTDGYVKVYTGTSKVLCGRTQVIKDTLNPNWNQTIQAPIPVGEDLLLELWDEDMNSSDKIGVATIPLRSIQLNTPTKVSLTLAESKLAKKFPNAVLTVSVLGWCKTYETVKGELMHHNVPGCLFNDTKRHIYVPASQLAPGAYVKVEYDTTGIDVKLLSTANTQGRTAFDIGWVQAKNTKIRRRVWPMGERMDGLTVYEELKLDDLPLSADFSQVLLMAFDAQLVYETRLDEVVAAHGWKGALSYRTARNILHGCDWDDKEEEIFMSFPNLHDGVRLVIDFDKDDVDMKVALLEGPTNISDLACDLTIAGQSCKKTSNIFNPHRVVCAGKYRMARQVELDDVKFGTRFRDMHFTLHQITAPRHVPLSQVISLR